MHSFVFLAAKVAPAPQTADNIRYGLLISVIAVEATLSVLTWYAFNAESRLEARDRDIRDAIAGYGSGRVLPALAELIRAVLAVRKNAREDILDVLSRADTSRELDAVVDAAVASKAPRDLESRTIRAWTIAGIANLVAQLSGLLLLLNTILHRHTLSKTVETISGITLIASAAILGAALVFIRQLSRSLTRAIRAGKDAGDDS